MPGYDFLIKSPHKGPSVNAVGEDAIRGLAEYVCRTRWEDLPPDVIEHARRILLDTIGVTLGGSIEPEATDLARRLGRPEGKTSTLIGHPLRASPLNAALANGTAATWMDFDSGHRPPPGKPLLPAAHPPVHLVPAALAVGEAVAASGTALLTALVVGYDAGARIGMASRVRAEIHCHGTHHNVAAAAAAARLIGATREQIEATIGLASHLSLMPSFENAYQGGTVRNTYAAVGAAAGILAAQFAMSGFTPEQDALGSVFGGVISPWFDPGRVVEALGQRFEITQGFIKLYPMCRFGHPAIEAAQKLVTQYPISPEDIEAVDVHTFDWAATLNERSPETDLAAKFSVPWAVACMLVRRKAGRNEFCTEAVSDSKLRALAERVSVREDPRYTAMTPVRRPARVTVRTKEGKLFQAEVERSSGGPDAPLSREMVVEKFRSLADPILGSRQAETVVDRVMHLEEEPDIRRLTRLLIPGKSSRPRSRKNGVEASGRNRAAGDYLDQLVEMVNSVSLEKLPSSAIHEAKRTLVDTVGVIMAGMSEPPLRSLARQMAEASVAPCSTILGSSERADAMWTALVLGTAGVWHEFDAGNRFLGGHPAIYAVSAGLAVAEREGVSGKCFLESVIAGYEIGARVGLGTTLRPGMDSHGSWPIVAAAATAGLLVGTDLRETVNLVTSFSLATSSRAAQEGASIRNAYAGFGSATGILAADLCLDGFTAERDGISTVFGTIAGVYFDIEKALEGIGARWEIGRSYYKPYSCSRHIHPALDGLIVISERRAFHPDDVERIEVFTYGMASRLNCILPKTPLSARFSIPYTLAAYLLAKGAGITAYQENTLHNPQIQELSAKIIVQEDPEINGRTPYEQPARVRIYLKGGKVFEQFTGLPRGEFDCQPLSDKELDAKFLKLASETVGKNQAELLLERLWHIEAVTDLRKVMALGRMSEQ